MTRLYLMPITVQQTPIGDARAPKYMADLNGTGWASMDYGAEPACMVAVTDPSAALHTKLTGYADCVALPADLHQQIGAQVAQVQNVLEALNIPSQWVAGTHTYVQVCRIVAAMFQFMQRLQGLGFSQLLNGTVTLGTRFNQLPQGTRTNLLNAAQSLNFDTSSLSGTSTIRQILKAMADQWGVLEIHIGGLVI